MTQQLFPYGTASTGSPIGGPYPGVQFVPTEAQGVVCEIREIQGAIWTVQNATFNTTTLQWNQVNVLQASYAFVRLANGVNQFLSAAAVGSGTLPQITFIVTGAQTAQPAGKPGGRLTLTPGSPVMPADAANSSNIYYDPYQTNILPIFNGLSWTSFSFNELTLALQAGQNVSGSVYDVFAFANGAAAAIGTGPAWTSQTARGTGVGTTQLTLTSGLWTNTQSITLWNAGVSTVVGAGQATYLGSIFCNATAQVSMTGLVGINPVAGGSILGLYNAYNHVTLSSKVRDGGAGYAVVAAGVWQAAQNNTTLRVQFLDGLAQSSVYAQTSQDVFAVTATNGFAGISVNTVTTAPSQQSKMTSNGTTNLEATLFISDIFQPLLGVNFYQAMVESSSNVIANANFNTTIAGHIMIRVDD